MQGTEKNEPKLLTLTSPGHTLTQTFGGPRTPGFVVSEGRLSSILASPRAIMVLVPLIVLALGAALTIIGQVALGSASRTMAKNRFVSHTTSLTRGLEGTLAQAEPLLDELARIAVAAEALRQPKEARTDRPNRKAKEVFRKGEHEELTPVALEMRDLLVGRPGITQAYIAFPDGTFLSADPAGTRSVGIQVTQGGQSASYQVHGQKVRLIETRKSKFNPKTREWYKLAENEKKRVWSAPYTFFFNQHTGVTRSHPIYKDEQKTVLAAIVGVDFDVDALTAFMAGGESREEQVHSVVFTLGGVVLAYPRGAEKLGALQAKKRVPTHEAIGDPVLSALIREVQKGAGRHNTLFEFTPQKNKMLASARRVEGGPSFYVATFSPERSVLKELYKHRKSSLWVGALSLLMAVGLAWLLARRIYLIRRAAHLAQIAAREAQGQVRDLGSYRLVERIGEGGMGEVWRATHRLLARQAAIKLIKSSHATTERRAEQRERFRREAQAIAGLRSRNTIALYDYGVTHDGTLFYVMELLEGIDLNSLVLAHGPQSPERVRRILLQACNSLGEAHRAQLVHRDVKPANLFLCREADEVDIVKVLDFGLVFQADDMDDSADGGDPSSGTQEKTLTRVLHGMPPTNAEGTASLTETVPTAVDDGRITRADHQLGTPAFMSPEQATGSGTDGRSDIYSLACVGWWLLCGKAPFYAESAVALMLKHIEEPPPELERECKQALSPDFRKLILSCLEKSPLSRPQSAEELGAALRTLGSQGDDWSDEMAQIWWKENVPWSDTARRNISLPPLRDAEVIPPEAI